MSFRPPTYNLMANVWNGGLFAVPIPPVGPPTLVVACQLRMLRTAFFSTLAPSPGVMGLLVQPGTDIRPELGWNIVPGGGSAIECPAGSGRYYRAKLVDDVARGFTNGYRMVVMQQVQAPRPIP